MNCIPVNEPFLTDQELQYVSHCVRTGWVSSAGRFIDEFEERWAAYCGRHYGDRKSTRLNSSHQIISYAVFCLKKKKHDVQRSYRCASKQSHGPLGSETGHRFAR